MNGIKAVINSFIFKNDSQSCSKSKLNKVVSLAIATISLVGAALAACPKQVFDSLVTIISNISSTIRNVVAKSKQIILGDCSVPANTVKEAAHAGTAMSEIQSPKNTVQVPESSPSFMFNQDNYSWSNISNISKSTIRNVVAKSKQIILEDCSVPANTVSIALPTEIENTDSADTHTTDNEIATRAAIGRNSYKSAETVQVPESNLSFKFNQDNYSWSKKDGNFTVEHLRELLKYQSVKIYDLESNYQSFENFPAKFVSYYISHTQNVPFYEIYFLVNGRRWDNPEVCFPKNVNRYYASISYTTDRFNLSNEDKKAIHKFLGMFLYMAQLDKQLTKPASIPLSCFEQIKKLQKNIAPADLEKSPILKSFFADVEFLRIEVKRLIKVSRAKSARK